MAGFRHRLARRLAPMRRGGGFVKRIDRDRPEYAKLHRDRLLERGAALGFFNIPGKRRPRQIDAGALGLGRGRLRFGAADRRDAAFAAGDALGRLMQIADRALAADRPVISVLRLDAEPVGKLPRRILIAPAQEVDDVERADLVQEFAAAVLLGPRQRLLEQRERLKTILDVFRAIDDLADADDDGNAVFGELAMFFSIILNLSSQLAIALRGLRGACHRAGGAGPVGSAPQGRLQQQTVILRSREAASRRMVRTHYSATSAFMCSIASIKSSLNSCTTAPADFTLSIRPTPWPTK